MYNQKLENLIDAALSDGVLTEKEKQVLFKKAQAEGIDLDEFEIILDAKLLEAQEAEANKREKAEKEKAAKAAPKSNKLGDVRKCPQCGAVIGTFQMICPECGFEFSGVGPNKFVEKFSTELRKVVDDVDGGRSIVDLFDTAGGLREQRRSRAIVKAEINFVKNYPLPLTKEDCIEMLYFILPKTHLSGSNEATKVWRSKYSAILNKLESENRGNQKILDLVESYKKQAKVSGFGKFIIWYKGVSEISKFAFWTIVFSVLFFGGIGSLVSSSLDETKGIEKVKEYVESGNIDAAKIEIMKGSNSTPLYEYYMENKMWEDAEEYIPNKSREQYFDYLKKVVTVMCQDGDLKGAKKFIKRKVAFYESNNNYDHDDWRYREWNTTIVENKLNAIVDNF